MLGGGTAYRDHIAYPNHGSLARGRRLIVLFPLGEAPTQDFGRSF
jgi:hypothetical protein